jgi:hypothetical protein
VFSHGLKVFSHGLKVFSHGLKVFFEYHNILKINMLWLSQIEQSFTNTAIVVPARGKKRLGLVREYNGTGKTKTAKS